MRVELVSDQVVEEVRGLMAGDIVAFYQLLLTLDENHPYHVALELITEENTARGIGLVRKGHHHEGDLIQGEFSSTWSRE